MERKSSQKKVIIIGAGTSGAVIAHRISKYFNVNVYEKSKHKDLPAPYKIPLGVGLLFSSHPDFHSVRYLENRFNRSIPFFESNSLGGASVINGCVHVLGNTQVWKANLERFGLNLEDLNHSYNKLYNNRCYPQTINIKPAQSSSLDSLFHQSLSNLGLLREDTEFLDRESSSSVYNTCRNINRSSVLDLNPFKLCKLKTNTEIQNLVVNNSGRIIGVFDGQDYDFADIIIISAGVIATNLLLLKDLIRYSDLSSCPSPFVSGQGIQDHTNLRVNIRSKVPLKSLNEINSNPLLKLQETFKHFLGSKTLLSGTGASSCANIAISQNGGVDTRFNLLNFYETGRLGSEGTVFSSAYPGFSISITHIHPQSRGNISLDRNGNALVNPCHLYHPDDIDHLKQSLGFVLRLLRTNPISHIVDKIEDVQQIISNPEEYICNNFYSGYHLIGGCSDLIDENFGLIGSENTFICDASVFNDYVSSNIHSSAVLISDLFSSKLLKRFGYNALNY